MREEARQLSKGQLARNEEDRSHSEIQAWLRDLGLALGFRIWIAANDRGRIYEGVRLGRDCLEHLPEEIATAPGADAVRLIDVLWIDPEEPRVCAAFEVEHSTSIYSGIVRMLDLALSGGDLDGVADMFLVAPDARECDVRGQMARPAFSRIADLNMAYLPYSELASHREQIARFGSGKKAIRAIARLL